MAELMRDAKRTNDWVKSILSAWFARRMLLITGYYKDVERTEKSGRQQAVWRREKRMIGTREDEVEKRKSQEKLAYHFSGHKRVSHAANDFTLTVVFSS